MLTVSNKFSFLAVLISLSVGCAGSDNDFDISTDVSNSAKVHSESALQADKFTPVNSVATDSGTVASDETVYFTVVGKITSFKGSSMITINLDNAAISPIQVSGTVGSDPEQGTYFVTETSVSISLTSTNISTRLRPALVKGVASEVRYRFIPNTNELQIVGFTVGTQTFPLTI